MSSGKPQKSVKLSALLIPLIAFMLLFCSCAGSGIENAELYEGAKNAAAKANYRTAEVISGDLTRNISISLEPIYSFKTTLYASEAGLRYEPTVKRGDTVSEGDVIALIYRDVQFADVEEARLALERMIDQYDSSKAAFSAIPGRAGELALYEFELNYERALSAQRTVYEKLLAQYSAPEELLAPFGAVVSAINTDGTPSNYYDSVMTLSKLDSLILFSSSSSSVFNFGMPVTIEYGGTGSHKTAAGRVSSTDATAADGGLMPLNATYVSLEEPVPFSELLPSVQAKAVITYAKNAVLVPLSAVTNDKGKSYVNVLSDDGTVHKRYITKGATGGDTGAIMVQVLSGLEAGQVVVLN